MRLELGWFPVTDLAFGPKTRWVDGRLEIDRDSLVRSLCEDPRILQAEIELARPGESVRIIRNLDFVQPQVKVSGPGRVYPGVSDRPLDTVGQGRTHRLGNLAVVDCGPTRGSEQTAGSVLDMDSAPYPYNALHYVALAVEVDPELSELHWFQAVSGAGYKVSDHLAEAVRQLVPPELEVFDFDTPVDASLPRVVFLPCMNAAEHFVGLGPGVGGLGTAVYGMTRLHPPWLLHPLEILDGAITLRTTWQHANNPIVLNLCRQHGKRFNVLGVVLQRTRWTSQGEKDLMARQAAKLASMLDAQGVILTWDYGGNDFVEVMHTIQACEREGLKTVLMTTEYSGDDESAPPLIYSAPDADAIVSLGTFRFSRAGARASQPERVVGGPTDLPVMPTWPDPRAPSQLSERGAYIAPLIGHFSGLSADSYGFGCQSGFTF